MYRPHFGLPNEIGANRSDDKLNSLGEVINIGTIDVSIWQHPMETKRNGNWFSWKWSWNWERSKGNKVKIVSFQVDWLSSPRNGVFFIEFYEIYFIWYKSHNNLPQSQDLFKNVYELFSGGNPALKLNIQYGICASKRFWHFRSSAKPSSYIHYFSSSDTYEVLIYAWLLAQNIITL